MIVKTPSGYMVTSEKGRPLSAKNLTKEEAKKRLAQIHMFEAIKEWKRK